MPLISRVINNKSSLITIVVCFLLFTHNYSRAEKPTAETSVQTIALFKDRAMVSINGKKAKIINRGQTYLGVKLIESNTDQAIVEVNGKREILTLNGTILLSSSLAAKPLNNANAVVQLWADSNGFFQSRGMINGRSLKFLVDTGANLVVLNSQQADRIQLDYKNGRRAMATTASGQAQMYLVEIDNISFETIELNNILVGVIVGAYPTTPLLGMSFLKKVDMKRSGDLMELKKRF